MAYEIGFKSNINCKSELVIKSVSVIENNRAIRFLAVNLLSLSLVAITGCGSGSKTTIDDGSSDNAAFAWQLPAHIPAPIEPADNPMSEAKFQLGRHLFYDLRLSGNGQQGCVTCHQQAMAFTDGLALPSGSTGEVLLRNSQPLTNAGYFTTLTWANPSLLTLEKQALVPLFGESPVEQGIHDGNKAEVLQRLKNEPVYAELFSDAFSGQSDPVNFDNIVKALASFVRGLTSFNSAFDEFEQGNITALSASAERGRQLFFSERLECFHCHGGYMFSDATADRTQTFIERPFHNTGLFNIGGTGAFPEGNRGTFEITGNADDMGKFRAPTLRNIALTAPYMHDGSMATLEEVLTFYAAGGRNITAGDQAGDGRASPFKDGLITGFTLSTEERTDLIAFLNSLTDETLTTSERFANPWN